MQAPRRRPLSPLAPPFAALLILLFLFTLPTPHPALRAAGAEDPLVTNPPPAVEPAFFDPTTKPGDDFFRYANGGWTNRATIPADRSSWGITQEMDETNAKVLHQILDDCAAQSADGKAAPGTPRQKVGDLFRTGMDEAAIKAAGLTPLAHTFDRINTLADRKDLPALLATLHLAAWSPAFTVTGSQDEKNSTAQIAVLYQGGLGLPSSEYYTKDDPESRTLRAQYARHVAITFLLKGSTPDEAATQSATVLRFETELAKASRTPVELRDPESNYNKLTLAELAAKSPGFDWTAYFAALHLPDPGPIDVCQPGFFVRLGSLAAEAPLDDWKTYLTWQVLDDASPYLHGDFENESFRFSGTILRGIQEQEPRWKRVLHVVDEGVGQALGEIYVADHFPPEAKARTIAMVNDLKDALRERINAVDWMGADTKAAAVKKLEQLGVKIGYADKWRDYSALEIKTQPYVLNAAACRAFDFQRRLDRIGKPVDPNEWDMTPPTINAYYDPNRNEVVFPAGILQPPNFDLKADDAANYGNTGATIGHEMTHGFDDQGRQYDGQGNLKNWWTFVDFKRFEERGQKIIKQFGEFEPQPGLHVNGKLTEGENIADLGGLKIAYIAFQKARERQPPEERDKVVNGLTPDQRFFISYAQSWRGLKRPESVRLQVLSNPHSPESYRVNGPVANLPEFAEAFGLPAECPEVRPASERVNIW